MADNSLVLLADDDEIIGAEIIAQDMSSTTAAAVTIENSKLKSTSLANATLERFIIDQSHLESCDLSNVDVTNSSWNKCLITSSRLTGFKGNQGKFRSLNVVDSLAHYSQWQTGELFDTTFTRVDFAGSFFNQAKISRCQFSQCKLDDADFSQAIIEELDIRGCSIENIKLDITKTKKLTVDPSQALYLIRQLGVEIEY